MADELPPSDAPADAAPDASTAPPPPSSTAPPPPPASTGTDAPASAPPGDAPEPWEGKSPAELWELNGKLREENVRYKERFRPFEEAFGGVHEQDAETYRLFLRDLTSGDPERQSRAAGWMRAQLDAMSPADRRAAEQQIADDTGGDADDWDPFDPAAVDKRIESRAQALLEQREQAAAHEREIQKAQEQIITRSAELAKQHGIPGFGDTEDPDHALLLLTAQRRFAEIGDPMERLAKAAEAIRDHREKAAQQYLKSKAADADAPAPPQGGQAPSGTKQPRTLKDAREAARARLDAQRAGSDNAVGV